MDNQVELLKRRLVRERLARKNAEEIIEEKSRELYARSRELERTVAAERRARSEVETLLQAFEAFTSRLDFKAIVTCLEAFIKRLIPHDYGEIYFFDGEALSLYTGWAAAGERKAPEKRIHSVVLLDEIRTARHPMVISGTDKRAIDREWGIAAQTKTWMVVSMAAQGTPVGCLTLGSRQTDAFCTAKVRLVQAIANEAAVAFENARLFREVQELSTLDPLTGLSNRRHFNATALVELQRAQRYALPLSLIMMDIDYFKRVNDRYGHAAGDRVLGEVAKVCGAAVRSMDFIARYGGEEFCFLLPETPLDGAFTLAERLRAQVAALHFDSGKGLFSVTASFGVAERLGGQESMDNLLKRSDEALYEAKGGGRNCVVASSSPRVPNLSVADHPS